MNAGFECIRQEGLDCEAVGDVSGVRWLVEVVGGPVVEGDVFERKLGRLLLQMEVDHKARLVLAVPRLPAFLGECERIPADARKAINLWWCVVDHDSVLLVKPGRPMILQSL